MSALATTVTCVSPAKAGLLSRSRVTQARKPARSRSPATDGTVTPGPIASQPGRMDPPAAFTTTPSLTRSTLKLSVGVLGGKRGEGPILGGIDAIALTPSRPCTIRRNTPNSCCPAVKSTSVNSRYGIALSTTTASVPFEVDFARARPAARGTKKRSLGPDRLYAASTPALHEPGGGSGVTDELSPTTEIPLRASATTGFFSLYGVPVVETARSSGGHESRAIVEAATPDATGAPGMTRVAGAAEVLCGAPASPETGAGLERAQAPSERSRDTKAKAE